MVSFLVKSRVGGPSLDKTVTNRRFDVAPFIFRQHQSSCRRRAYLIFVSDIRSCAAQDLLEDSNDQSMTEIVRCACRSPSLRRLRKLGCANFGDGRSRSAATGGPSLPRASFR